MANNTAMGPKEAERQFWTACQDYLDEYESQTGESLLVDVPKDPSGAYDYLHENVHRRRMGELKREHDKYQNKRGEILDRQKRLVAIASGLNKEFAENGKGIDDIRPQIRRQMEKAGDRLENLNKKRSEVWDSKHSLRQLVRPLREAKTNLELSLGEHEILEGGMHPSSATVKKIGFGDLENE